MVGRIRFLVAFAVLSITLSRDARGQAAGRPLILLVHGRGQDTVSKAALEQRWIGALRSGLSAAHVPDADIIPNVRFVYYGFVYTHGYAASPLCRRVANGVRAAVASPTETALQTLDDASKLAREPTLFDRLRKQVTERLALTPGGADIAIKFLGDVKAYFDGGERFCDTNRQLITELRAAVAAQRPIVLVAHSLGSAVAMTILHANDVAQEKPYPVTHLISFGSQLGIPELAEYVYGRGVARPAPVPSSVEHWLNLRGRVDYLGFQAKPSYAASPPHTIDDQVIDTPLADPHGAVGYLSNKLFAQSVATVWCASFAEPANPPKSCGGDRPRKDQGSNK